MDGNQAGRERVQLRLIPGGMEPGDRPDGSSSTEDADQVLRARAGDNRAREALFKRHLRLLRHRVYRLLGPDPESEDIVQKAFLRAFSNLPKLIDPQAFGSWLSKIAIHLVNHRLRRRKLLRRLGFAQGADRPEIMETVASSEVSPATVTEARRVYALLDGLPAEARVAFLLRHLEEMTVPEVSAQMGISERTVKRRVALAESRLSPYVEFGLKEKLSHE